MALIRTDMNLIASGAYGKVWSYISADATATIKAANYFNSMGPQLAVNDRIHVKASDGFLDAAVVSISAANVVVAVWSAAYA